MDKMKYLKMINGFLSLLVGGVFICALSVGLSAPNSSTTEYHTFGASPDNLILTFGTDNDNYAKGQPIRISGTVSDSEGNLVQAGTVTIRFSCGNWGQMVTTQIENGAYRENFTISYGAQEGTWKIVATAWDENGNFGEIEPDDLYITIPASMIYALQFWSPIQNTTFSRGENVTISVKLTRGGDNVEGASVICLSPSGENVPLIENSPGTYVATYTIKWSDPAENWSVTIEGKKTIDNSPKAGGSYINIQIEPTSLQLILLSPTQRKYMIGDSIEVKAQLFYPDGEPVENAVVSVVAPSGENLSLVAQGSGIYGTTFIPTSENIGASLQVVASDPWGNSGSKLSVVDIVPMPLPPSIFVRYWWAFAAAVATVGGALTCKALIVRKSHKLERVRAGMEAIRALQREATIKYFKESSISRRTFDDLMKKHERKMTDLMKEEAMLVAKMKKAKRKEPKKTGG